MMKLFVFVLSSFVPRVSGSLLVIFFFEAVVIKGRLQHLFLSSRDHVWEPRTVNKEDGKIRRGGNWWDPVFTRAIQYELEDCM